MEPWFAFYECAAAPLPANTEENPLLPARPRTRALLHCTRVCCYCCPPLIICMLGPQCRPHLFRVAAQHFIRHAFGNMWDVLMEISFSPMMASYLTYLGSESLAKSMSAPDENYAREIMQVLSSCGHHCHPHLPDAPFASLLCRPLAALLDWPLAGASAAADGHHCHPHLHDLMPPSPPSLHRPVPSTCASDSSTKMGRKKLDGGGEPLPRTTTRTSSHSPRRGRASTSSHGAPIWRAPAAPPAATSSTPCGFLQSPASRTPTAQAPVEICSQSGISTTATSGE